MIKKKQKHRDSSVEKLEKHMMHLSSVYLYLRVFLTRAKSFRNYLVDSRARKKKHTRITARTCFWGEIRMMISAEKRVLVRGKLRRKRACMHDINLGGRNSSNPSEINQREKKFSICRGKIIDDKISSNLRLRMHCRFCIY